MRRHHRPAPRAAYTIVELLVSMALIIFIMSILSAAFSIALGTFRDLKAIGDMTEHLRSASTIIRRDLAADHFEDEAGARYRLSDIPGTTTWNGSKKGFLYIRQDSTGTLEGQDADGIQSWRADASPLTPGRGTHEFGMTVKLSAKTQADTVAGSTTVPVLTNLGGNNLVDFATSPQQMVSQWAEVYYFLKQTGVETAEVNGQRFPLYTLYRRQRILAPATVGPMVGVQYNPDIVNSTSLAIAQFVPTGPPPPQPQFIVVGPESLDDFVTPPPAPGVFIPTNRLGGWNDPFRPGPPPYPTPPPPAGPGPAPAAFDWRPYPITGTDYGSDIVLNNVVSFRVQVQNTAGQFVDLAPPAPGQPAIFDTARPTARPQVRAMRIQQRIYHAKSNMTRQVSVIQDM